MNEWILRLIYTPTPFVTARYWSFSTFSFFYLLFTLPQYRTYIPRDIQPKCPCVRCLWTAECQGHRQRQHRTEHSPRIEIKISDPTANRARSAWSRHGDGHAYFQRILTLRWLTVITMPLFSKCILIFYFIFYSGFNFKIKVGLWFIK